ncbi:MAG: S-methyl-5-thioribose-1-phosphate isomerase [Syntrophales bacterium]|nr:S-methyl-5-thioribose-1-phosphate isomerase [Syntrophales bacterium]
MIKTIFWEDDAVVMIDQKLLPLEERYVTCRDYREVIAAINDLTVRGAPAIGVAAALGIALGALNLACPSCEDFDESFHQICEEFSRTRPTARNLFWAIERMRRCWAANTGTVADIKEALVAEARGIVEEDIAVNRRIGLQGRHLIQDGDRILTHCNAGALATAGYGTALGVIRAAHEEGKEIHVFVDETRPILQGARLTAWELKKEGIPATLITDSMAGFLMHQGKVDKVIVGADRIAGNGDVANKIGTYSLGVLARENGIPLYVAAPLSTIDLSIHDGSEIPIEERKAEEILTFCNTPITVPGIGVFNPAFDVTPHRYVTAIITEAGVAEPSFAESIAKLFRNGAALG